MRFHRETNGALVSPSGRYRIEKVEHVTDCEHPQCWPLHWRHRTLDAPHEVVVPMWLVYDVEADDLASDHMTMREARGAAERMETQHASVPA